MTLYIRLLFVIVAALFGRKLGFMDESRLRFRVWPHDIDLNMHMTNARYLAVMDLGRLDLILRNGLARAMLKCRWQAVLGATNIRYRRPLKPFETFEVITRPLCWDDKSIYLEQRIEAGGKVAAMAVMQGVFIDRRGRVPPRRIMEILGVDLDSPTEPEFVRAWRENELPAAQHAT